MESKNYFVGEIEEKSQLAIFIDGEWWPKSQISIIKKAGNIVMAVAPIWLFQSKGKEPISQEMAKGVYEALVTLNGAIDEKDDIRQTRGTVAPANGIQGKQVDASGNVSYGMKKVQTVNRRPPRQKELIF